MSSVATVNPSLASLIQNLSQNVSPLASSPKVEAALESASPSDIAQLSAAAVQLQTVSSLFGTSDPNQTDSNSLFASLQQPQTDSSLTQTSNNANTLLANLQQTLAASSSSSTYSPTGLDLSQVQTLFGNSVNLFG